METQPVLDRPLGPRPDGRARRKPLADRDARAVYRRLTAAGLDGAGAGNLTGFMVGLRPMTVPWNMREICALLFMRDLVRRERIAR